MLVVSVQMNTLECVYVKLMLYNIKSMFDGLMQNGREPSCRSPALPLLRLGPRSTDAASRLPTSRVRSGRRRAHRQRRPHTGRKLRRVRSASWGRHLVGPFQVGETSEGSAPSTPGARLAVTIGHGQSQTVAVGAISWQPVAHARGQKYSPALH